MDELIWIDGEVMRLSEARISVEDRGYQFADGVYEVVRIYNGKPFTLDEHLDRLERSAAGVRLTVPLERGALGGQIRALIGRSQLRDGMVYLQLTRGAAPRNHAFPDARPKLLFYCRALPPLGPAGEDAGAKLLPVPDERWRRCWIKSIALLPNVLAKNQALDSGYDEAVFIDGDAVSECSASNLFAVIGGTLITHPAGPRVLPGITRAVILQSAGRLGISVQERPLHLPEALGADELFISSTTREISWVSHWGQQRVGQDRCGPVTMRLHQAIKQKVADQTR